MSGPAVLTAEQAYVGALLWLDAPQAIAAHPWLTAEDFADPQLAAVHTLAGALAAQGVAPDPAAVLALARASGMLTTAQSHRALGEQLIELYDHRATVPANVRFYAVNALTDTYRRRMTEMATRLAQIAGHADLDELNRVRDRETEHLQRLHARLTTLQQPQILRSVAA
ncbi:MAG: hypothetical protein JWO67_5640 [Streptosporangiaceae bacterium]|nr:hypothetical protein [Streptosporangiaceae bacterium]